VVLVFLAFATAANAAPPTSVTIAGDLQSELGCAGDWDPGCAVTHLTYDSNSDVWKGAFTPLPAGSYGFKAALNDSWTENYGLHAQFNGSSIPLTMAAPGPVRFYFDYKSRWVTSDKVDVIANVPGDFQSELGCSGDWQPDCLRTWLQDPSGGGTYSFSTAAIPAGTYQAKVAHNESWAENYGVGGVPGGASYSFTVPPGGFTTRFSYSPVTHVLSITSATPPTFAKAFGAAAVVVGATTALTFTLANPAPNTAPLTGVGFTDTLPSGLLVATPNGLSGSCAGGTITAAAGSGSVSLAGATLPTGSGCTFSVNVVVGLVGALSNTTGPVTSAEGGSGGVASASLTGVAPQETAQVPALGTGGLAGLVALLAVAGVATLGARATLG
jgi:uncharacterized repeat protein (TIGR01451 family)